MDGTRMGSRSSSRHGPASVFSGPVRRWRKTWSSVSSSNAASAPVSSRLLLYKWVPVTPGGREETTEESTVRSSRHIPVSILLEQRQAASRKAEKEAEADSHDSGEETEKTTLQAEATDHPIDTEQATIDEENTIKSGSDVEMKDQVEEPTKVDGESASRSETYAT